MARVTVEDCIDKIPNRFEVVVLAAQRARAISSGAPLHIEREDHKEPVLALREIAEEKLTAETLRNETIAAYQNHIEVDEPEEDNMAALMGQEDEPEEDISEQELLQALQAGL